MRNHALSLLTRIIFPVSDRIFFLHFHNFLLYNISTYHNRRTSSGAHSSREKAARRELRTCQIASCAFREVDTFPQFPEMHVVYTRSYEDNFRIRSVDLSAKLRAFRSSRSDVFNLSLSPFFLFFPFLFLWSLSRQCIVSHGTFATTRARRSTRATRWTRRTAVLPIASSRRGMYSRRVRDRRSSQRHGGNRPVGSLAVSIIHLSTVAYALFFFFHVSMRIYKVTKERKTNAFRARHRYHRRDNSSII